MMRFYPEGDSLVEWSSASTFDPRRLPRTASVQAYKYSGRSTVHVPVSQPHTWRLARLGEDATCVGDDYLNSAWWKGVTV